MSEKTVVAFSKLSIGCPSGRSDIGYRQSEQGRVMRQKSRVCHTVLDAEIAGYREESILQPPPQTYILSCELIDVLKRLAGVLKG